MKAFIAAALVLSCLCACTLTERLPASSSVASGSADSTTAQESKYFGLSYYASERVNPITSLSKANRLLAEGLYEGLFVLDENLQPKAMLCSDYTTSDGKTYTFTLKEGVTFWSGEPLRATDVVNTYNLAKVSPASPYYGRMAQIQSVTAPSDTTVQIVLASPNTALPALLDIPIFRKGTEGELFSEGTGPFQPQSEGAQRWLIPYASWHGGAPSAFPKITLFAVTDPSTIINSFKTGDISLVRAARITDKDNTVALRGAIETYQTRSTVMQYLGVNCAKAPYSVAGVRTGISAAIDRNALCLTQLQSFADPAVLPVNPQPEQSDAVSFSTAPDKQKALDRLADVGVKDTDGDGLLDYMDETAKVRKTLAPVIVVNSDNEFKVAAANKIAEDLKAIGIQASVNAVSFVEYQNAILSGKFDMFYGETQMTADFDLRPIIGTSGILNYGHCANTTTDTLVATMRSSGGDALREAKNKLYAQLLYTMPVIPVAFVRDQVVLRGGLIDNFTPTVDSVFYGVQYWKAGT